MSIFLDIYRFNWSGSEEFHSFHIHTDSRSYAFDILDALNCETSEQFFRILETVDLGANTEILDTESNEHVLLRQYVQDTIACEGFENELPAAQLR